MLKQQLQDAHRKLQRTQSSSLNNAADSEALRQQATTSQAAADAAQAELAQLRQKHSQVAVQAEKAEKEKQLLLTNLQSLIKLNAELQAALTKERQQRVGSRLSSAVHAPCKHSLTVLMLNAQVAPVVVHVAAASQTSYNLAHMTASNPLV